MRTDDIKRHIIAIVLAITVSVVVMIVAGFLHPVFGYVAGIACAEAVYLWQVVRRGRIWPEDPVARGRE